ncbi:hypothetical protein E2320_010477 [Naja naja]|nr:hypothetical protein E2320_010477 [Naja naja]
MVSVPVSVKSSNESFRQFQKAALEKGESELAKERKRRLEQVERKSKKHPQEKERNSREMGLKSTAVKESCPIPNKTGSGKEQSHSAPNLLVSSQAHKMPGQFSTSNFPTDECAAPGVFYTLWIN